MVVVNLNGCALESEHAETRRDPVSSPNTLHIPASLSRRNLSGVEVEGFRNFENLTDVFIEIAVPQYSIKKNAFKGCSNLKSVHFIFLVEDCAVSICKGAFEGTALEEFDFKNVISVGDNAFANCKLKTLTNMNSSLRYIGRGAFKNNCLNTVDLSNTNISVVNKGSFADNNISKFVPPIFTTEFYYSALYRNPYSKGPYEPRRVLILQQCPFLEADNFYFNK